MTLIALFRNNEPSYIVDDITLEQFVITDILDMYGEHTTWDNAHSFVYCDGKKWHLELIEDWDYVRTN